MQRIESSIVKRVIGVLLDEGFQVSIDNGGEETKPMTDYSKIRRQMDSSSMDRIYVWKRDDVAESRIVRSGWVLIVYGNGVDCLADYTMNLESILKPVNDWVNTL